MSRMFPLLLLLIALLFSRPLSAADTDVALTVVLPDGKSVDFTPQRLLDLPRMSVTATAHDKTARYTGTDLVEVLRAAGLTPLENLRGPLLRRVVTAIATDEYRAVFVLAELDPSIGGRQVLLADREDDAALPDSDGPWRFVVAGDKRPARWVRQVRRIVVSDVE